MFDRPWYSSEIMCVMAGIRLSSANLSDDERRGFDLCLAALCISFNVDPHDLNMPEPLGVLPSLRGKDGRRSTYKTT